jgi:hypothetical protein
MMKETSVVIVTLKGMEVGRLLEETALRNERRNASGTFRIAEQP